MCGLLVCANLRPLFFPHLPLSSSYSVVYSYCVLIKNLRPSTAGIVVWEMLERMIPYAHLSQKEVVEEVCNHHLIPSQPTRTPCPQWLYNMMVSCWSFQPEDRPTFMQILSELQEADSVCVLHLFLFFVCLVARFVSYCFVSYYAVF